MGSEHKDGRWLLATLLVAFTAFALGIIGLAMLDEGYSAWDLMYHSLQLFVVGSDPLSGQGPYPWELEVARFLAPATTIYTVVLAFHSVLRDRFARRSVAHRSGHVVVTGDSVASVALAGNLRSRRTQVVLIGTDPDKVAQRQGIPVVPGDPRERTTLRAAGLQGASALYACAPQTSTNAAVVLAAAEIHDRVHHLQAFAQVRRDELVDALRVRQIAAAAPERKVTIDFFSLEDIAARQLLDKYPGLSGRVLIVGLEVFGYALLRAIMRSPHTTSEPLAIIVQSDNEDRLDEVLPQLEQTEDRSIQAASRQTVLGTLMPVDVAFVCLDDEDGALTTAIQLSRVVGGKVVLCLHRESPFGQALKETPGLDIFGTLDSSCATDLISGDAVIGRAARAIHRRYVESCRQRGDTELTNSSMRPWDELPQYLKQSNYAQAEHVGIKLREIGCTLVPARVVAEPFEFRQGEVLRLAKIEHARWMAQRKANGFEFGEVHDDTHHPDLVDWANLSEESKAKDIDTIEQLPALMAETGLQIHRLP